MSIFMALHWRKWQNANVTSIKKLPILHTINYAGNIDGPCLKQILPEPRLIEMFQCRAEWSHFSCSSRYQPPHCGWKTEHSFPICSNLFQLTPAPPTHTHSASQHTLHPLSTEATHLSWQAGDNFNSRERIIEFKRVSKACQWTNLVFLQSIKKLPTHANSCPPWRLARPASVLLGIKSLTQPILWTRRIK